MTNVASKTILRDEAGRPETGGPIKDQIPLIDLGDWRALG